MDSDERLVEAYRGGDQRALETLVHRYTRHLYNFIRQYAGGEREAEDVVQEAFIKAWRHLRTFDTAKSFKTWLFTIARNALIDLMRKRREVPFSDRENEDRDLLDLPDDDAALPEEAFAALESAESVRRALETLPPKAREVLVLRYQNELNFREIAAVVGEPIDTVKSRHRRALQALRRIVADGGEPKVP